MNDGNTYALCRSVDSTLNNRPTFKTEIYVWTYIVGKLYFLAYFYVHVACETGTRTAHHFQMRVQKGTEIEWKGTNMYKNTKKGI